MRNDEVTIVVRARDLASKDLRNISGRVRDVGNASSRQSHRMSRMASAAGRVARRMTAMGAAAGAAAAVFSVKSAGAFEQNRVALETMLGSAEKAQAMLKEVTEFAATTPFQLPEVVEASKQLLALGGSAEDVLPDLKAIGDIAAGTGAPLERLILNFGQVRLQGKLTGRELRDFAVNGVPLMEELADQFGVTESKIQDMVSAGEIGFDDVDKAFESMTSEGGKFFDLMDKQSRTFQGRVSNLTDIIGVTARKIVGISETGEIREGSLFARLGQAAEGLLVFLQENEAKIQGFFEDTFNSAMRLGEEISKGLIIAINAMKQAWDELRPSVLRLWKTFQEELLPTLKELWKEVLRPLLPIIGVLLVAALKLAVETLILLTQAVSGAVNWWLRLTTKIRDFINTVRNSAPVQNYIRLIRTIRNAVRSAWAWFGNLFRRVKNSSAFQTFRRFVQPVINIVDRLIGRIQAAKREFDQLKSRAPAGGSPFSGAGRGLLGPFGGLMNLRDLGGNANGGGVQMNSPTWVGERGPEVFVPQTAGKILPAETVSQSSNTTNINGTINLNSGEAVNKFFERIDRTNRLASQFGVQGAR